MQENIHELLGLKALDGKKQVIRLWRPGGSSCPIEVLGKSVEAKRVHEAGLFEYEVPHKLKSTDYLVYHPGGKKAHDPYAFPHPMGELDVHLLTRGLHYELYNLLGATVQVREGVVGVHFALWAPNARYVSLIGDFNHWDGSINPMRPVDATGVWELFIPGLDVGEKYKFQIHTREGETRIKSDPVAYFGEVRPKTASIVFDVDAFVWNDAAWFEERKKFRSGACPVNIYEVHPGSWQREHGEFLGYRELGHRLAAYCKKMGYTHVELMGILEHPLDESWGYQVSGYFAPTSRYGTPEDFQYLVDLLHQNHIGVLLDWVPAHFPRDDHSLARFDGTYLYEHIDPRQGFHPQWNTHIFNFGRFEVSNFLIASALFWLEKMHIDGLRVDAVASMLHLDYGRKSGEWVPNEEGTNINLEAVEFLKHMNSILHERFPSALMIAEDSTTFEGVTEAVEKGGLGFDLKWNLGWMNDTLTFFSHPFDERKKHLDALAFIFHYCFDEKYLLVLSHDEVVHEKKSLLKKMPGSEKEQVAGLRLLLSFMMTLPGKKLLFMGGEWGQKTEWNCKEQLDWDLLEEPSHRGLQQMVSKLGELYLSKPALHEGDLNRASLQSLKVDQAAGVISYTRTAGDETLLIFHHLLPGKVENYTALPEGEWDLLFNSDSAEWGGSDILSRQEGASERVHLAPLSTQIFVQTKQ